MKKSVITFCAAILLATQAPIANAQEASPKKIEGHFIESYSYTLKYDSFKWVTLQLEKLQQQSTPKVIENKIPVTKPVKKPISTKAEETPAVQAPTKAEQTPVVQAPTKAEETPAVQAPTKAEEKPVAQAPTKVEEKPVAQAPTKVEEKPVAQAPTKAEEKPVAQAPTKAEETPVAQAPTQAEETPAVQAPTKVEEKPVAQAPTKAEETPVPVKAPVTQASSSNIDVIEAKVVELTNIERAKYGLNALQMDKPLMAAAREKSQDMKTNNYFSHTSPTYGSPFDRLKALGISYKSAGENIAKGQKTPEQVVEAWMNSEGHRANILNGDFTHIGVGYVTEGSIWTQQFIKK